MAREEFAVLWVSAAAFDPADSGQQAGGDGVGLGRRGDGLAAGLSGDA
jgi:hypothetical protein